MYIKQDIISHIERLLILASTVIECVSISGFVYLICIPVGIASSSIGLITAGNKKV